jgi:uncharacterized protein (TIGR03435 family)
MAPSCRLQAYSALLAVALGVAAFAQTSERFEVASIKPHGDSGSIQAGIEESPGFVRIINLSLRAVVAMAYGVKPSDVSGPSALDRRTFDIVATPPDGYTRQQLPALVRNLLTERFSLVAHRETREGRGYALRVPTSGHRLRESVGPRTFLTGRPGLIAGNGRSIGELVALLSQMVSAPVVDETSLKGAYDLKLEWSAQLGAAGDDISIFTALREQLGLRLDTITARVDTVIVTSIRETPTPD